MKETRGKILDVAEKLFAADGYSATPVRRIIEAAGVNISAVNYYFGDKESLFIEVLKRRFSEIEKDRFDRLQRHISGRAPENPTVEGIVRAFLEPLSGRLGDNTQPPKMLIRAFSEKQELKERLKKELFSDTRRVFGDAFQKALPHIPPLEVQWRFQFLISSMCGTLHTMDNVETFLGVPIDSEAMIDQLIWFVLNGIKTQES